MTRTAQIDLPNGRQLDYEIRSSAKAKSLRLKMTARGGLTVIAPNGLSEGQVIELVRGKKDWIVAHLKRFDEVRHLLGEQDSARPEAFDLPALAETWRVEYQKTKSKTVGARTDRPGRILVYGDIEDHERCKAALRRWLARRAKVTLGPWLETLSRKTEMKYSGLTVKSQRTRWGSCSANGVISLNCKLLFLPKELVRYVLIHELCHTLELNHSPRFWTLVRAEEPNVEKLHGMIADGWKYLPTWLVDGKLTSNSL